MKVRKRTWESGGEEKTAWVVDYFDRNKKRHIKTFQKKKDADAALHDIRGELTMGVHTAPSKSMTVAAAVPGWLVDAEDGTPDREALERSTIREYRRHAESYFCDPMIGTGNIKLGELTYGDVLGFQQRLAEAGKSKALIRKIRGSLSSLLSDQMLKGRLARHVIRDAPRHKRPKDRQVTEMPLPTKAEINALLRGAQGRFRAFLSTLIFTGMRISEVRGLYWKNVDFRKQTIKVCQRADRWGHIGAPKSQSGNRTIPMAPMVVNTLKEWKLGCPKGDLVFPSRKGIVLSHSNLQREFSSLQRGCGVSRKDGKPYGFHALRHAAASMFIEQRFTPKKVQELMGHASIQMTFDRYGHLFDDPESDQDAFAQIQARLVDE